MKMVKSYNYKILKISKHQYVYIILNIYKLKINNLTK